MRDPYAVVRREVHGASASASYSEAAPLPPSPPIPPREFLRHTDQKRWAASFRTPPQPVLGSAIPWTHYLEQRWLAPRPHTLTEAPPSTEDVVAVIAARVAELDDRVVELRTEQRWTDRELAMRRPVLDALGVVEDVVNVARAGAAVLESEARGAVDQVREVARRQGLVAVAHAPAGLLRQAREARAWYRWWRRGGE